MSTTADLVRAVREERERERERWCGGCALWQLAAVDVVTPGRERAADVIERADRAADRDDPPAPARERAPDGWSAPPEPWEGHRLHALASESTAGGVSR